MQCTPCCYQTGNRTASTERRDRQLARQDMRCQRSHRSKHARGKIEGKEIAPADFVVD